MGTPDPDQLKNLKMLVAGVVVFVVLSLPSDYRHPPALHSPDLIGTHLRDTGAGDNPETFSQISGMNDIAMCLLVALFIVGIIQAFRIGKNKGIFLVLITVLTFVISDILSFKMPMLPRYLIFLSIVFFLGIAVSYRVVYSLWNTKAVVYGFIVVLFVISARSLPRVLFRVFKGRLERIFRRTSAEDRAGRYGCLCSRVHSPAS